MVLLSRVFTQDVNECANPFHLPNKSCHVEFIKRVTPKHSKLFLQSPEARVHGPLGRLNISTTPCLWCYLVGISASRFPTQAEFKCYYSKVTCSHLNHCTKHNNKADLSVRHSTIGQIPDRWIVKAIKVVRDYEQRETVSELDPM